MQPWGEEHIGRLGGQGTPSTLLKYFCKQQKIVVIYTERRIIVYEPSEFPAAVGNCRRDCQRQKLALFPLFWPICYIFVGKVAAEGWGIMITVGDVICRLKYILLEFL